MTLYIVAIVLCLALSAFFSSSEMSFNSANRLRIENESKNGNERATGALKVLDNYENALSTILIGNNLVNIANSSIASVLVITFIGAQWTWAGTALLTIAVIIFGETIPKIVAKKNANRLVLVLQPAVRGLIFVLTPIVRLMMGLSNIITFPFKGEKFDDDGSAVEELQSILEVAEDESVLSETRSELMQSALEFMDVCVSEVMTARVDVSAVDLEETNEEIMDLIDSVNFSRLPVYHDNTDNVVGILSTSRFLKAMANDPTTDISSLLIEPHYVYKTIKLPQILSELRSSKKHMAVVTGEYGEMIGVVSMEDILETIVGEIYDESDVVEDEVIERGEDEYELDGGMSVSDFVKLLDIRMADFDYESETVGGWVLEVFEGFPTQGAQFSHKNFQITVLEIENLRVDRVFVKVS